MLNLSDILLNLLHKLQNTMVTKKTISMPDELAEFVDEENIALSGFVQDKLREKQERREKLEEAGLEELA